MALIWIIIFKQIEIMKRILLFLTCITCCFYYGCGQEIAEASSSLATQLENPEIAQLIDKHSSLFPDGTQLSIALIDGDKTTFIGVSRADDNLQKVDNSDAIFEIGSISKVFTSILFSKQINSNVLSKDDALYSVISFSEKASEQSKGITLQMLANHTSGLPRIALNMMPSLMANEENPYKAYTAELLEEFYQDEILLDNSPGSTYAYSNLGTGTLGYILTTKANKTYEALLQEDILKPLGMGNSSSILSEIDNTKLIAGLGPDGEEVSNWDFTDAAVGAGGIKSNAIDMEKFIRKNFEDDAVYNLAQLPTFTVSPELKVGLGWHISIENDTNYHWHNGGTGGYRSCMVLDKSGQKAVLVLSNVSAFGPQSANIDNLCFELLQKI